MGTEFETRFDEAMDHLSKKGGYTVLIAQLCEWYRTGDASFAVKQDQPFLKKKTTRIQFAGMLLKHVLKLLHLQAKNPKTKVLVANAEATYRYIEVEGLSTRLFFPSMSYTEQEALGLVKSDDIETALEFIDRDDLFLRNLVTSLVTKRYKQRRKKALDEIEFLQFDCGEGSYCSEELFFAVDGAVKPYLDQEKALNKMRS